MDVPLWSQIRVTHRHVYWLPCPLLYSGKECQEVSIFSLELPVSPLDYSHQQSNMLIISPVLQMKTNKTLKSLLISYPSLGAARSLIFLLPHFLEPAQNRLSSPPLQRDSSYKGYQSRVHCFIQWSFILLPLSCAIRDFLHSHSLFLENLSSPGFRAILS